MANLFASYSHHIDITHVTGYTEYSLMQVLDQAGFHEHRFRSSCLEDQLAPLETLDTLAGNQCARQDGPPVAQTPILAARLHQAELLWAQYRDLHHEKSIPEDKHHSLYGTKINFPFPSLSPPTTANRC